LFAGWGGKREFLERLQTRGALLTREPGFHVDGQPSLVLPSSRSRAGERFLLFGTRPGHSGRGQSRSGHRRSRDGGARWRGRGGRKLRKRWGQCARRKRGSPLALFDGRGARGLLARQLSGRRAPHVDPGFDPPRASSAIENGSRRQGHSTPCLAFETFMNELRTGAAPLRWPGRERARPSRWTVPLTGTRVTRANFHRLRPRRPGEYGHRGSRTGNRHSRLFSR